MNICIISGDAVGGLRKHVHDLIFLAPKSVNIFYIHSKISDSAARSDFENLENLGVRRVSLHISKNPVLSDLKNILTIWRFCRDSRVDLLHGHSAKGGLYARLVGFLMRKPVLYTPHGGSVHSRFGIFKSLLFASVEFVLKFLTTLFVFESQYTRTAFRKLVGAIPAHRELINYNGVHLNRFVSKSAWQYNADRKVRLLTVGLLSTVKGQDVVINAVAILKSRGFEVLLDLCGDGVARHLLETQAVTSQVAELVRFHGDIIDVRPYYEVCDIVVIPSRFESFGYVAVEAALMGRPIVATATGGLLETVINGETGISFEVGCPNALADAVETVLGDVDATQRRINVARERAIALFDVDKMAHRLYATYAQFRSC